MAPATSLLAVLLFFSIPIYAFKWKERPGPYRIYKTEPSFFPNLINVTWHTIDHSLVSPGYVFVAPHVGTRGFGPQIVDIDGDLIWYGNPTVTSIEGKSVYGMNFYVCDFMGQRDKHLCYSEARPSGFEDQGIQSGGANRIFDNSYEPVIDEFAQIGTYDHPNPHEFNVLPGGNSFIQSVYNKIQMDLRDYGGAPDGYVFDGCFQEIDMHSRSVLFDWCFLDHHPVHDTYMYLDVPNNKVNVSSKTSGRGVKKTPWDFIHLNAVDKNEEGDYIVSGRHLNQVLKIAGHNSSSGMEPGSTIWRLNGKYSDFDVAPAARFARQHHARFISTGKNETVISLFNNAVNGTFTNDDRSSALILRVNNSTKKATVDEKYLHPKPSLCYAQGSMSIIPGHKNTVFIGWGSDPEWSEFSRDGTILYHAGAWANQDPEDSKLTNYRAYKFEWTGKPRYPPKLLAFSRTCEDDPVAYVSWNGATEVGSWRFYISNSELGPRQLAGIFNRTSFESNATLSLADLDTTFAAWVTVEAIDKTDGTVLGMTTSKTFVPSQKIAGNCDSMGCYHETRFEYDDKFRRKCIPKPKPKPKPKESWIPNSDTFKNLGKDFHKDLGNSSAIKLTLLVVVLIAIESWTSILRRTVAALVYRGTAVSLPTAQTNSAYRD